MSILDSDPVIRRRRHGSSSISRPLSQFIVYSQNHDQVGNRAGGERLSTLVPREALKVAAAACLLAPNIPLLFMGEEYGETAPFQYFTDHGDPALVEAVRKGRRAEFASFAWEGEVARPTEFRHIRALTGSSRTSDTGGTTFNSFAGTIGSSISENPYRR